MRILNLNFALVLFVLLTSCSDSETQYNSGKNVSIELVNPTNDKVEVKIYDKDGWLEKVELAPLSSKDLKIEEGNYSVVTTNLKSNDKYYFPDLTTDKNQLLKDTSRYTTQKGEDGKESIRYKFKPVFYANSKAYPGKLVIDVTFNKKNKYAVANASWLYTETDIRSEYEKFIKGGNKLISAGFYGQFPFVVLDYTCGPYSALPDSITTRYGIKGLVPKVYSIPDSVEVSQMNNYVLKQMLK